MSCKFPKPGWRYMRKKGALSGYYKIKEPSLRPCGQCLDCRLDKSREWALRCTHEAMLHEENSFITLTYNNKNLPEQYTLVKAHLQLFMKRLRKALEPKEIRFYGAGEYGDNTKGNYGKGPLGRPHYHLILFNHQFSDKTCIHSPRYKMYKNKFSTSQGCPLYTSKTLEKIWQKGFVTVGDMTIESAAYVARYTLKKLTGDKAPEHYQYKIPEFALMSRKPGIGADWLTKFKTDAYPKDFITVNGHKKPIPKYYDYLLEKSDPTLFDNIKHERSKKEIPDEQQRQEYLLRYRKLITKPLQRSLHNDNHD